MSEKQLFHCMFLGNHLNKKGDLVPNGYPDLSECGTWEQLISAITKDRRADSKSEIRLFVPGKLFDDAQPNEYGSTLENENIEHISFLAFDIEGGGTAAKPKKLLTDADILGIHERLLSLPFETCFFNSYSDGTPGKGRRARILVPLKKPINPTADYGQTRQSQGAWWSSHIFLALAAHVLGDWVRHEGVLVGLNGCKILTGKYYLRSSPVNPPEEPWVIRQGVGEFFDAAEILEGLNKKAITNQILGLKDATGFGIPEAKLKKILKKWQNSDRDAENLAAITLERLMKGQKAGDEGSGFETVSEVCRLLVEQCRPFDPKVVANTLFKASNDAYGEDSTFVEKRFDYWLQLAEKADVERAEQERTWRGALVFKSNGEINPCMPNVLHILKHHPAWTDVLGFNERTQESCFMKDPPCEDCRKPFYPHPVEEHDANRLTVWFCSELDMPLKDGIMIDKCVEAVAAERLRFDDVREYMESLVWDGISRLDTWLINYAGVVDNKYNRAISSKWLISAVARTFNPGCKADHVLVLEGDQGVGKSTLLRTLCKNPKWFTDSLPDLHNKDVYLQLRGKLIIEVGELNAIQRSTNADIKKFFSSSSDTYRAPYDRRTKDVSRRLVFSASTNEYQYTSDPTGARRFWPVKVAFEKINIKQLAEVRDQLWAEAVHRYVTGEEWWLGDFLEKMAAKEQRQRRQEDPFEEVLDTAIAGASESPLPEKIDNAFAAIGGPLKVYSHKEGLLLFRDDVYTALGFDKQSRTQQVARRVKDSLRSMGWVEGPKLQISDLRIRTFYKKTKIIELEHADT